MSRAGLLILAGGGHSHALLLKRWAMHPKRRPNRCILLINRHSTALYSGMVPGLIAGLYKRDEISIDLRQLCDRAGVAFIEAGTQASEMEELRREVSLMKGFIEEQSLMDEYLKYKTPDVL